MRPLGCAGVAARHTAVPASSVPSSVNRHSLLWRRALVLQLREATAQCIERLGRQIDAVQHQSAGPARAGRIGAGARVERKPRVEVERPTSPRIHSPGCSASTVSLAALPSRTSARSMVGLRAEAAGGAPPARQVRSRRRSGPRPARGSRRSMRNASLSVAVLCSGAGRSIVAPSSDDSTIQPIRCSCASTASLPVRLPAHAIEQRQIVFVAHALQIGSARAGHPHASAFARHLQLDRPAERFGGDVGCSRVVLGERERPAVDSSQRQEHPAGELHSTRNDTGR